MSRPQTRAEILGVQPGRLSAKTLRKTAKIRALMAEIDFLWLDIDEAMEWACEKLTADIATFEGEVAECLAQLREPVAE